MIIKILFGIIFWFLFLEINPKMTNIWYRIGVDSNKKIVFKNKGDTLVLLSDGLPEAENQGGEMIGYEKTEEEIKSLINLSAEEIKNGLVKLCESWLGDIDLKDDMTLVIIKKK